MTNEEKIKSLKKEYDLTIQEVKKMYMSESFNGFLYVQCTRCQTRYNLPAGRSKKEWKCGVCKHTNDFDFNAIFVPLKTPHLGPLRSTIEKAIKTLPVKIGENEKRNGEWKEYPCYFRL